MSPEASAAAGIGYACFVIACVLYVLCLLKDDNYLGRLAMTTQTGGLLLWGAGWVWALVSSGDWPQLGAHDVLLWLVLVCVTASLLVERLHDMRVHSPWVLILVLLLGGVVMFRAVPFRNPATETLPAGGSMWTLAYGLLAVVGYGLLVVSGTLGIAELVRPVLDRRFLIYASLSESDIERIVVALIRWAMLALASALLLRVGWSWLATGMYWSWALVEVWMLVTWAVYGVYVHWGRFRQWPAAITSGMLLVGVALAPLM